MRRRTLLSVLLATGASLLVVRAWPSLSRRIARDLRWRAGRARTFIRERRERRVSIIADMGRPPHKTVIWSGFEGEADAVRAKLPKEFGRTWISPER